MWRSGGKRVLVRVDFNVPLDEETGEITDDSRIQATLPTIRYLIEHGARVILMSHLGRPKGKVVEKLRMAGIARRLSHFLEKPVAVARDCIGPEVEEAVSALKEGDVLMLENLRFHPEEEAADEGFIRALAGLGDIFVNDAFGAAHRAHASVSGVARHLPAVAGMLMEREINTLGSICKNPEHPFIALLGGAKVSDKVSMLHNIMGKVDSILVGGGMAATFLKAGSYPVGSSLVEAGALGTATRLLDKIKRNGARMLLPVDAIVADDVEAQTGVEAVAIGDIPAAKKIVDIGPQTTEIFRKKLQGSRTVFWNGPMGIHEIPRFAGGTRAMARILAELDAATVIGGGSTAEVVIEMGLADKMSFVSTGGGASLKFLGGEVLPGVAALLDKQA